MENPPNLSFRLQGLNLSFPYRRWRINYCCLVNSKNEGGWIHSHTICIVRRYFANVFWRFSESVFSVHEKFCGGRSFEEFEPEVCSCLGLNLGKWITMVVFVVKFWEKLLSDSIARV